MEKKMKVIIDMDIGDDIDDAIALYAAMRQEFDIIGITTVFRNTMDRARKKKSCCRLMETAMKASLCTSDTVRPLA
jgi:purine nucleosidase/pyrimidine-specific ribonucleoside hydrolase